MLGRRKYIVVFMLVRESGGQEETLWVTSAIYNRVVWNDTARGWLGIAEGNLAMYTSYSYIQVEKKETNAGFLSLFNINVVF